MSDHETLIAQFRDRTLSRNAALLALGRLLQLPLTGVASLPDGVELEAEGDGKALYWCVPTGALSDQRATWRCSPDELRPEPRPTFTASEWEVIVQTMHVLGR